jgi:hypothetical protein
MAKLVRNDWRSRPKLRQKKPRALLTQARLKQILSYQPESGIFRWKQKVARRVRVGDRAGNSHHSGYVFISIGGRLYAAHRLAWFYVYGEWPKGDVDHKNTIRSHNWIDNLRLATRSQNVANGRLRAINTVGLKGVSRNQTKWMARIRKDDQLIFIGNFDSPEEAHAAYVAKAEELFGEFANQG